MEGRRPTRKTLAANLENLLQLTRRVAAAHPDFASACTSVWATRPPPSAVATGHAARRRNRLSAHLKRTYPTHWIDFSADCNRCRFLRIRSVLLRAWSRLFRGRKQRSCRDFSDLVRSWRRGAQLRSKSSLDSTPLSGKTWTLAGVLSDLVRSRVPFCPETWVGRNVAGRRVPPRSSYGPASSSRITRHPVVSWDRGDRDPSRLL